MSSRLTPVLARSAGSVRKNMKRIGREVTLNLVYFCAEPVSMSPQKALEQIGNQLQKQYERWQPRARYKQLLDPTTDDVRKLCVALRKNAKVEAVIVHMYTHIGSVL